MPTGAGGKRVELDLWHRLLYSAIRGLYFHRIRVLCPERLPASGPALYVLLHRNGAVDGFVYNGALPRAVTLISTQLRRSLLGRLFFTGIELARPKDEEARQGSAANAGAFERAVDHLAAGGELSVFPEGTSSLGPRHLPFKGGAAHLILRCLERGVPLKVVPLGVHYESAWSFQADVEIAVGEPVSLDLPEGLSELGRLKELRARVQDSLEEVGVNVESAARQEEVERLAYAATLGTRRSYFLSMKSLEDGVPGSVREAWDKLAPDLRRCPGLMAHQRVPLFPVGPAWRYVAAWLVLAPLAALGVALNAVPLAVGWTAGDRFADDLNVVSLWRVLVGVPVFALWVCFVCLWAVTAGEWTWGVAYLLATELGLGLYYRVKKLTVAVNNVLRQPGLGPRVLEFRELVLRDLPDRTVA